MKSIKSRVKLLLLDIDGTLLSKECTLSIRDKKALALVRASGIKVSLSSGRAAPACLPIINQLSLDGYHTSFDGALVSNPKTNQEVYAEPISDQLVEQIIDFAHHNKTNLELFSANRHFIEREIWTTDIYRQFFGIQPIITNFTQIVRKERIIKGTLIALSPEEKTKAKYFYRHFKNHLTFSWAKIPAYSEVEFISVLSPGVSKGKALENLVAILGISLDEVMAIGDGPNDASVFSRVGLAVAMGNAHDELKAMAHYTTLDVNHNGVATAINQILFTPLYSLRD